MTDVQLSWYKNVLYTVGFSSFVLLKYIGTLNEIDSLNHSQLQDVLIKLQKVCNHPYLLQEVEKGCDGLYSLWIGPPYVNGAHLWETSGKMIILDRLLSLLKDQHFKVVILTQVVICIL